MVARQSLTLLVWVQILVPQPKNTHGFTVGVFVYAVL